MNRTEGITATLPACARELGLSRDELRRVCSQARVQPVGGTVKRPIYRLADIHRAVLAQVSGSDEISPHARLALARAIQTELATSVRRGELIELHDHERVMAELAMLVARTFDTATDNVERDVGLSPLQADRLERHFDEQREALARQWAGDDEQQPKANGHAPEARPEN